MVGDWEVWSPVSLVPVLAGGEETEEHEGHESGIPRLLYFEEKLLSIVGTKWALTRYIIREDSRSRRLKNGFLWNGSLETSSKFNFL